jgi:hypothetical protein
MVNLIGTEMIKEFYQVCGIAQISVVEEEADTVEMGIAIEVVDARRIEGARTPDNPVDLIALGEEEFGKVGTVLASNAGY